VAPPLVTEALFAAVQERLAEARSFVRRPSRAPTQYATLLHGGFIRCGYCGCAMRRVFGRSPAEQRYRCFDREGTCNWSVSARRIDPLVWERIAAILAEPEQLEAALAAQHQQFDHRPTLDALAAQAAEMERQQRNISRAIARIDADSDAQAPLLVELAQLGDRLRRVAAERERLEAEQARLQQDHLSVRSFAAWCRRVQVGVATADWSLKRDAVRMFDMQVTVWKRSEGRTPRILARPWLDDETAVDVSADAALAEASLLCSSTRRSARPARRGRRP
jgi:hypothetical protein